MVKNYSKKEAVSIAISAARLYRDNFVGKKMLFVFTNKHKKVHSLEVGFDASNYHHLTGLKITNSTWSHLDFYKYCIDLHFYILGTSGRLSQFVFQCQWYWLCRHECQLT